MPSIFDWSSTASSNTACDGINVNTGMAPANVDNVFRSLMAMVRGSFSSTLQNFLAGTAGLPVSSGGTGATNVSAAQSALNALDASYRDLNQTTKSLAFTFSDSERGWGIIYSGAAAAATINPNATTGINTGAVYVIHNNGTGVLTVTPGAGVTLKKNGSTSSASAAIAVGGVASLVKWGTDYWTINGAGVS